jgi:hypothetical protein
MPQKRTVTDVLVMAGSILAGGLTSAALVQRLVDGAGGMGLLPLVLGAAFAGMGWFLAENIGDAAYFLLLTGLVGAVTLAFLHSGPWRTVVIAFLCGFNTGKVLGSIYREYRS